MYNHQVLTAVQKTSKFSEAEKLHLKKQSLEVFYRNSVLTHFAKISFAKKMNFTAFSHQYQKICNMSYYAGKLKE